MQHNAWNVVNCHASFEIILNEYALVWQDEIKDTEQENNWVLEPLTVELTHHIQNIKMTWQNIGWISTLLR